MNDDRTLVIIPTYNERKSLPQILPQVLAQGGGFDILVVDDGSPDGTGAEAERWAAENPGRIHVLHRSTKGGLGPAYIAGFRWGLERGYGRLCEMDADLSHPPDRLPAMVEALEAGAHVVVGSRYVGGKANVVNWPITRLFISVFGSWYARKITGLPLEDATGGFNMFRADVLQAVDLSKVESNGYSFQIELKFRAWRAGFTLVEIPIIFTERAEGESKMSRAIVREAIWRVWKLRLLSLTGRL
jgi:dolichol-phosphate mannosyltransferase